MHDFTLSGKSSIHMTSINAPFHCPSTSTSRVVRWLSSCKAIATPPQTSNSTTSSASNSIQSASSLSSTVNVSRDIDMPILYTPKSAFWRHIFQKMELFPHKIGGISSQYNRKLRFDNPLLRILKIQNHH